MLQILTYLGAQVERASGTVSVTAEKTHSVAPYDVVRKMRASVCVLGPSLGRCKEATVALPGGCVIGDRPIDLHLTGFEALGAAVRVEGGDIKVFAPKLTGAVINMQSKFGPTVLGTDNVMMAAVLADGVTVIEGAAQEPEVVDLATFLNKMGAKIEGAGTRRLIIEGVPELHGAEHRVIPDRIEAGTFLVAGAINGKGVTVKRVEPEHIRAVTDALARCGFPIEINNDAISIMPNGVASALELKTEPYPGFPTDMGAQAGEYGSVASFVSALKWKTDLRIAHIERVEKRFVMDQRSVIDIERNFADQGQRILAILVIKDPHIFCHKPTKRVQSQTPDAGFDSVLAQFLHYAVAPLTAESSLGHVISATANPEDQGKDHQAREANGESASPSGSPASSGRPNLRWFEDGRHGVC